MTVIETLCPVFWVITSFILTVWASKATPKITYVRISYNKVEAMVGGLGEKRPVVTEENKNIARKQSARVLPWLIASLIISIILSCFAA